MNKKEREFREKWERIEAWLAKDKEEREKKESDTKMISYVCANCKWYNHYVGNNSILYGECRRFPPAYDADFPYVEECYWCGEFNIVNPCSRKWRNDITPPDYQKTKDF